jgi:hypothetical protein
VGPPGSLPGGLPQRRGLPGVAQHSQDLYMILMIFSGKYYQTYDMWMIVMIFSGKLLPNLCGSD